MIPQSTIWLYLSAPFLRVEAYLQIQHRDDKTPLSVYSPKHGWRGHYGDKLIPLLTTMASPHPPIFPAPTQVEVVLISHVDAWALGFQSHLLSHIVHSPFSLQNDLFLFI